MSIKIFKDTVKCKKQMEHPDPAPSVFYCFLLYFTYISLNSPH